MQFSASQSIFFSSDKIKKKIHNLGDKKRKLTVFFWKKIFYLAPITFNWIIINFTKNLTAVFDPKIFLYINIAIPPSPIFPISSANLTNYRRKNQKIESKNQELKRWIAFGKKNNEYFPEKKAVGKKFSIRLRNRRNNRRQTLCDIEKMIVSFLVNYPIALTGQQKSHISIDHFLLYVFIVFNCSIVEVQTLFKSGFCKVYHYQPWIRK